MPHPTSKTCPPILHLGTAYMSDWMKYVNFLPCERLVFTSFLSCHVFCHFSAKTQQRSACCCCLLLMAPKAFFFSKIFCSPSCKVPRIHCWIVSPEQSMPGWIQTSRGGAEHRHGFLHCCVAINSTSQCWLTELILVFQNKCSIFRTSPPLCF